MSHIDQLPRASSELIAQRALQDRVDTKFIFSRMVLEEVFSSLSEHYAVVMAGSEALARYGNQYFDCSDFSSLRAHHRGQRPRFKVRIRHHLDREQSFLEVKEKRNTNRTRKQRLPIAFMQETLDAVAHDFISTHLRVCPESLEPSLRVDFTRITLVGLHTDERVTFDTGLHLSRGETHEGLSQGVIAEVKQHRFKPRTPIMLALRGTGALQMSVSKYCTAAQMLVPDIKLNRYRPRMRMLRRRFDG